jgi:hypothetical protein
MPSPASYKRNCDSGGMGSRGPPTSGDIHHSFWRAHDSQRPAAAGKVPSRTWCCAKFCAPCMPRNMCTSSMSSMYMAGPKFSSTRTDTLPSNDVACRHPSRHARLAAPGSTVRRLVRRQILYRARSTPACSSSSAACTPLLQRSSISDANFSTSSLLRGLITSVRLSVVSSRSSDILDRLFFLPVIESVTVPSPSMISSCVHGRTLSVILKTPFSYLRLLIPSSCQSRVERGALHADTYSYTYTCTSTYRIFSIDMSRLLVEGSVSLRMRRHAMTLSAADA